MFPYTDSNISKFGNTKKTGFKEAMEQIEANYDFINAEPVPEEVRVLIFC